MGFNIHPIRGQAILVLSLQFLTFEFVPNFDIQTWGFVCCSDFVIIDQSQAAGVNSPMQLRKFSIVLAVLIMCVGFLPGQTQPDPETGIEGVITINPWHPGPIKADEPLSKSLANSTWVVKNDKGEGATEFTTDAQGRFQISLPPGRYSISLKGKKGGVGKFGPFDVEVVAGKMTRVQWQCDSGLR